MAQTAAGDASTNITANDASDDGGDVGICLVGADSPCNDAPEDANDTNTNDSEHIGDDTDADDGRMGIPEDQDGDGEIDERFQGDDSDAESGSDAGICLVGADSPCNDAPANGDDVGNGTIHIEPVPDKSTSPTQPTPNNDSTDISSESDRNDDSQIWIPEDHNRDGYIDDRFIGTVGQLVADLVPLLAF
ncbi:hypothetical protein [Halovenus salina]|uniref:Uncharacterized protein n=1 Tax=Halovenus salina TaxID=1510225 RepID=A0ABD5W3V1_9EURY